MEDNKLNEVIVYGVKSSPYCSRVELALKFKGIPYKYITEDLENKSDMLLHYNPVHKKVPVLVHNGKPLVESLVIMEYIDEFWNHSPKLFPDDPYEKAKFRFWFNFYDQKIVPATYPLLLLKGNKKEKAKEKLSQLFMVLMEGLKKDFPNQFPFSKGRPFGLLDIFMGTNACNYKAFYEVSEISFDHKSTISDFSSWMDALKEHPLMKEILPSHDLLVSRIKQRLPHYSSRFQNLT